MSSRMIHEYRDAGRTLAVAAFAQRNLPRGKGAVPRYLGKIIGRRPMFLVTRHGAHLVMAPNAWDVYATMALNGGSWDYQDFEWCINGMSNSSVFFDIGANVGYFSLEMSIKLGANVRIVAFEPQSQLVSSIASSVMLNNVKNITVVQAIVGDTTRQAELYLAPASIHASAVPDSGRDSIGTVQTQMVTIDDLVENGKIPPPDMVKIDVEGSEHLVFQGASRTFLTHKPHIFLEYIAKYDYELRVRHQVERLVGECDMLELFGHASSNKPSGRQHSWFRMCSDADWQLVDSLFLRNVERPVRDALVFEP